MGLNKTKSNEKSKSKQIKTGKIGKLEAKRKKIIEIKERKKNERLSEKMQKKVEEAKAETKVDQEGFFVLPTEVEINFLTLLVRTRPERRRYTRTVWVYRHEHRKKS